MPALIQQDIRHQWISYHLHFQIKSAFRWQTEDSWMEPYYTNYHTGRGTREKTQMASRQHPDKLWYYHVTRRVKPGEKVGFDALGFFNPPADGRVEGTAHFSFECIAR